MYQNHIGNYQLQSIETKHEEQEDLDRTVTEDDEEFQRHNLIFNYTIDNCKNDLSFNVGRWTWKEMLDFKRGIIRYFNDWSMVAKLIRTRKVTQVRSHAQKFILALQKKMISMNDTEKKETIYSLFKEAFKPYQTESEKLHFINEFHTFVYSMSSKKPKYGKVNSTDSTETNERNCPPSYKTNKKIKCKGLQKNNKPIPNASQKTNNPTEEFKDNKKNETMNNNNHTKNQQNFKVLPIEFIRKSFEKLSKQNGLPNEVRVLLNALEDKTKSENIFKLVQDMYIEKMNKNNLEPKIQLKRETFQRQNQKLENSMAVSNSLTNISPILPKQNEGTNLFDNNSYYNNNKKNNCVFPIDSNNKQDEKENKPFVVSPLNNNGKIDLDNKNIQNYLNKTLNFSAMFNENDFFFDDGNFWSFDEESMESNKEINYILGNK